MDCPKCGTWNPDDKRVCWRCQTEMHKPVEKKAKKPAIFLGLPVWMWVVLVVMMVVWIAVQCVGPSLLVGQ